MSFCSTLSKDYWSLEPDWKRIVFANATKRLTWQPRVEKSPSLQVTGWFGGCGVMSLLILMVIMNLVVLIIINPYICAWRMVGPVSTMSELWSRSQPDRWRGPKSPPRCFLLHTWQPGWGLMLTSDIFQYWLGYALKMQRNRIALGQ